MKTNKILSVLALSLTVVFFSSCELSNSIKPSDNYITRTYKVGDFNKIYASAVGDIYYTQSTDGSTSLEIYGPDNIVEMIDVSIDEGKLSLAMQNVKKVRNINKMKITISSPDLSSLKFKGVGNVHIDEGITTNALLLDAEGVGNIYASGIRCNNLTVCSRGVGDVKIVGESQKASLSSEGVGNINAVNLKSNHVEATSKGIGNITCYAVESISASVNGIGSIEYKGNPTDKNIIKGGIGSIKKI